MFGYADVTDVFRIKNLCTAFTTYIGEHYHFVGERHDFWELVIVIDGEVGVTAGERTSVLRKGEAILHYPMEFHRVWYAGNIPAEILIFSFAAENVPQLQNRQFILPDLRVPLHLLDKIRSAFRVEEGNVVQMYRTEIACHIALKELEVFLLELMSGCSLAFVGASSKSAENYTRLVRCLTGQLGNDPSVEEIARLCNMSTINAKQTFARYAGMGIRDYFNRLRIERAITLLREGSSVQETAAELAFSSPNYFSTTFKRITGKPPTAYK